MAYTIGASHGPFTGLGNFLISKPAGIRTVVTGIPFYTGRDTSSPTRYFRLGRFTLGNTDGFQNSVPIEYAQQVAYPIAPDWELLAYDIRDGASCLFQELVAVPDLTAKQPWDRTPTYVGGGGSGKVNGASGLVNWWTYTVPVGRRLLLGKLFASVSCVVAPTAVGAARVTITIGGVQAMEANLESGTLGLREAVDLGGGSLIVNAGVIVAATYQNSNTGGAVMIHGQYAGNLFDA